MKRYTRRRGAQLPDPNTVYSVAVWRGAEIEHYDLRFEEDRMVFYHLGGYWDGVKPFAGPSRREALWLYSVLKKRRREAGEKRREDFEVKYDDIVKVEIEKGEEESWVRLWLRNGRWLAFKFPTKIYDLVYKQLKRRLEKRLRERGGWVVKRAR